MARSDGVKKSTVRAVELSGQLRNDDQTRQQLSWTDRQQIIVEVPHGYDRVLSDTLTSVSHAQTLS